MPPYTTYTLLISFIYAVVYNMKVSLKHQVKGIHEVIAFL